VRKKPKQGEGDGDAADTPPVNVLGAGLVRKKQKT
jgi:regulator of Ty1 transposition protein 109